MVNKQKNCEESPLSELRRTTYIILALLPILQKQPYLGSEKFSCKSAKMDNGGFERDLESRKVEGKRVSLYEDVTSKPTAEQARKEKRGIYKNLVLISVAFLLHFTAFGTTSSLQSSINKGLGATSQYVQYAAIVLSCMFVPSIMIEKMTVKWAMVVSVFCYSTNIAAQLYPEYYTLLPTAVILGLGAGPLWTAQCTYFTQVAHRCVTQP